MENLDLRTLNRSADFYFVRHGESEGNRAGKILGRMDLGLSELGRDHARAAGRFFASQELASAGKAYVATSPLTRCRETAALLAEEAGLPEPQALDDLIELNAGVFAGKGLEEIAEEMPEQFRTFRVGSWEVVDGAERIASLYGRAVSAWNHLIARANAGADTVIAVTHAGFMQWILKATFGGPDQRWMPVIKASNCGIFHCHAEPTYLEARGEPGSSTVGRGGAEEPRADGFFAEWRLMNYLPYE
jgi:broad specificity phosphatase PhoE